MLKQPWWFFISDLAGGMQCAAFHSPNLLLLHLLTLLLLPSILCYLPARGGQRPACLWSCDPQRPRVSGPKTRNPALPAIHWIYSISTCFTKGSIHFLNVFICFFVFLSRRIMKSTFYKRMPCHDIKATSN